MTAGTYHYTVNQGSTDQRTLVVKDENDDVVDLTGSVVVFRALNNRGVQLLRKSSDGDLTIRAIDGEIDVFLTPAETRLLPLGRLTRYEIEYRIDENELALVKGFITVEQGANDDA